MVTSIPAKSFSLRVTRVKEFMAIRFNDFLVNPQISTPTTIIASLIVGFILAGFTGGTRLQFFLVIAGGAVFTAATLTLMELSNWFLEPSLGIFGVSFLALCNAAIVIQLISGLESKKGRIAGFGTAVTITALYYPLQLLMSADASFISVVGIFSIQL